ncbi:hypothetical protein LOK46_13915 [Methylobacterium sp. NMS14P]|uniref:hypothetical protein n=1 Tax=Methylobacterium sp. NMS14P TaxID=2894310 RepID=UPI0023599E95|nr:hypothetical protein [Methylobacterium sp. NMS14P]WCS27870.1 hypothetical protein LOK46_13915 [Methylobacterium sp. NMS14P]
MPILAELGPRQPLTRRVPGVGGREQSDPAEDLPLGLTLGIAVLDYSLPRAAHADPQAETREIIVEDDEAILLGRELRGGGPVCEARSGKHPVSRRSDFSGARSSTIRGYINFRERNQAFGSAGKQKMRVLVPGAESS